MGKLDTYISDCALKSFKWGEHDCAHFAANWAKIYSGKNFLNPFGFWDSEVSAAKVLIRGGGFEKCVRSALGQPIARTPKDGDLALLPDALGGLCVVYGAYAVGPAKPLGLNFHPFSDALHFWELPCQM